MIETIDYAGLKIAIRSNDRFILEEMNDFFMTGGCSFDKENPSRLLLDVELVKDLKFVRDKVMSGARTLLKIAVGDYIKEIYTAGEKFIFHFGDECGLFSFDKKEDILKIWLVDRSFVAKERFLNIILTDVIQFVLRFYGVYFIHAAGVAKKDSGILLVGPPHAGKSIIALQLVKDGFRFLSDDKVGLRQKGDRVEMIFSPEWLGLTEDAGDLFKDIKGKIERGGRPISGQYKKIKIPISRLFSNRAQISSYPKLILFLKRSFKNILKLSEIGKKDALLKLLEEDTYFFYGSKFPDIAGLHFSLISGLINQAKVCELNYSLKRLSEISTLIDKEIS